MGPRDGLQNVKRIIPARQKVALINRLSRTSLPHIEITSFVDPERVPQFADASEVARNIDRVDGITYSALVANTHYLGQALDAGLEHVAIFISAHEEHSRNNLGKSISDSLGSAERVTSEAFRRNVPFRAYLSTVFGYGQPGEVSFGKVAELTRALFQMGAEEVSLGDTTGLANPETVVALLSVLRDNPNLPFDKLAMHFHDGGFGTGNVLAAYVAGIRSFDSSIGGIGGCPFAEGATGNVATEDVVAQFSRRKIATGINHSRLIEITRFLEVELGLELSGGRAGGK